MNKVSIITINLNNKLGLEKTIESVISQNYDNYEFVIIDGASIDGSIDIIKKYKKYITYFTSEPDTGIYNAMNKGIKVATGEYLHFLNSGDLYASENVLQDVFNEKCYSESFICGNYFYESKGNLERFEIYKGRDWSFSLYEVFAEGLCHQAFFIHRDMFKKYGYYDETLRIASDFKLFFIAIGIHNETVRYIDTDIVIYNTEGFSSNVGGKAILKEKQVIAKKELSQQVYNRINNLYHLERNQYMTDFILSRKWFYNFFRAINKITNLATLKKKDLN